MLDAVKQFKDSPFLTSFQMQNKPKIIPKVLTLRMQPLLFLYKLSPSPTLFNFLTSVHQAGLSLALTSFRKPSTLHLNQGSQEGTILLLPSEDS